MGDQHAGNGNGGANQGGKHEKIGKSELGFVFVIDGTKGGAEPTATFGMQFETSVLHTTIFQEQIAGQNGDELIDWVGSQFVSILRFVRQARRENDDAKLPGRRSKWAVERGEGCPATQGQLKVSGIVNRERVLAGQRQGL